MGGLEGVHVGLLMKGFSWRYKMGLVVRWVSWQSAAEDLIFLLLSDRRCLSGSHQLTAQHAIRQQNQSEPPESNSCPKKATVSINGFEWQRERKTFRISLKKPVLILFLSHGKRTETKNPHAMLLFWPHWNEPDNGGLQVQPLFHFHLQFSCFLRNCFPGEHV